MPAAAPNVYESRPARLPPVVLVWMMRLSEVPAAKNTLSTMPIAASSLMRVKRRSSDTTSTPSRPVTSAPHSMTGKLRSCQTKKPRQMPGNPAWARASPSSARRRNTAKQPANPAPAPSTLVPASTTSVL
jgi:hypothetical protein